MNAKDLVLSVMLAVGFLPVVASAKNNPYDGRLVKAASSTAVYYVGPDQKRHAFPNEKIYFSWYASFSRVEEISDLELAQYPLGANVQYRPGSRMIKIPDVPEVYAIEPGGRLRNVPSEQAALALYGPNWAKKIDDMDISFFFDYEIDGLIDLVNDTAIFPRGTLVNYDSQNYIVDKRTDGIFVLRPITQQAWAENQFDRLERQTVVDPSLREFFDIGLPVTTAEALYSCPACSADLYKRDSIAHTSLRASANEKYRVQAPDGWDVSFPTGTNVVTRASEFGDDGLERSFTVYRVPAADTNGDFQAAVDATLAGYEPSAIVYAGKSLFLSSGQDAVVRLAGAIENDAIIYWSHFISSGDAFYELQFFVPESKLSASVDLIDTFIRTYEINPSIID